MGQQKPDPKEHKEKKKIKTEARVLLVIIFGYALFVVFYMVWMMANAPVGHYH